jgi:hypothetical protein
MRTPSLCAGVFSLVVTLSLLSSSSPAFAQKSADRDLKAYGSYRLTMPKYKKYLAAMMNMAQAGSRNPKVASAMEDSGSLTSDQMVARLNGVSEARRAITGAGLTTRDYVLTQGALLQTGIAHGMMKQLKISPDSAIKAFGVSRANLEFVDKNEAEITRSMKETEAKMDALQGPDKDDGEDSDE